jgi:solute:Na+ symporter, SSS family
VPSIWLNPWLQKLALSATAVALFLLSGGDLPAQPSGAESLKSPLTWKQVAELPAKHGLAGPIVGMHEGALIVAGGANFPDGRPWEGAAKVWHDEIYILRPTASTWETLPDRLPTPLAYSVCVTTPRGIAVIGGNNADGVLSDAFLMRLENSGIKFEPLPRLPGPLANACGALIGDKIYVAGGQASTDAQSASSLFLSLDLSNPTEERQWQELPTWPGAPRMLAVSGVQNGAFYLFGGVELFPSPDAAIERRYLSDAYRYSPDGGWKPIARLPAPLAAAPSPAISVGTSHLLVLSGDGGEHAKQVGELQDAHPGFRRRALAYHCVTDQWIDAGETPFSLATTPVARDGDTIMLASGETRPGVRSTKVWSAEIIPRRAAFGAVNLAVLGLYPVLMLGIGVWSARKSKDAEGFFRGGQQIPWWAAGLSIYATMLSSITFMAIPAKAYYSNWWFILSQLSIIALAPIIIAIYLPFFRQLNLTSAYEYLELRFNLAIRLFGSTSFIAFQIARTGIVLYLPALALSTVSSLDTTSCIVGMTLLTITITYLGGMEAVIWTDVAQSLILLAAAGLSLLVILTQLDGGFFENLQHASSHDKFFPALPWSANFMIESGWVLLLGTFFATLISYTSNQEVIQRFMTTQNEKEAARAIWVNALLSLPSGILFFAVGTALFLFYDQHPARLDPSLSRNDAIFPYFMVQELPAGVAGFVVAGIFAAAQPTSSLNSIATAVVTDFYQRLHPAASSKTRVRWGRVATFCAGMAGMAVALTMERFPVESLWELFLNVLGLTTGILAGLFSLGILTRRAHGLGAVCGVVVSAATMWGVSQFGEVHALMFGCLAVVTCFVAGYFFSLITPSSLKNFEGKNLDGLTIHTLRVADGPRNKSTTFTNPVQSNATS